MTPKQLADLTDDQLEYFQYADTKSERQRISREIFGELQEGAHGTD